MICSTSEEVSEHWESIIGAFLSVVEYDIEFNKGVPIYDVEFLVRHGLLFISYKGGNKATDAFAAFARVMSSTTCTGCGAVSTQYVFNSPKCDNCD